MNLAAAKLFASIIAAAMSFLGWNAAQYGHFLSPDIRSELGAVPGPVSEEETTTAPLPPKKAIAPAATTTVTAPVVSVTVEIPPKPKPVTAHAAPPQKTAPVVTASKPPVVAPPAPKSTTSSTTPVVKPPVAAPPVAKAPAAALTADQKIKAATINILCTMPLGEQIAHYTGSGVMIDPSGVILTNAHVAEHVLLEEAGDESCSIRTGSPAASAYKAKVVYLPDAWVESNKTNLSMQNLVGNGENDYALLILTTRIAANAPDVPVPFLAPDTGSVSVGSGVSLAGYPLLSQSVSLLDNGLYLLQEPSTISNIAGFDGRASDVIDTEPTSLAEHGSSGGSIVGASGGLVGIIDATTVDATTGRNDIQGITLSYIERSIQANSGQSFQSLIANARADADAYEKNEVPGLAAMLMQGVSTR